MTLKTIFGEGIDAKTINFSYLIVYTMSPYNIILVRPPINVIGAVVSTQYLTLKYLLLDERVGII